MKLLERFICILSFPHQPLTHPSSAALARVSDDAMARSIGASQKVASRALCHHRHSSTHSSWTSLPPCWLFYQVYLFLHFMRKSCLLTVVKLFLIRTALPLFSPGLPHFSPVCATLQSFTQCVLAAFWTSECKNIPVSESILAFPHFPYAPQSLVNSPNHQ